MIMTKLTWISMAAAGVLAMATEPYYESVTAGQG